MQGYAGQQFVGIDLHRRRSCRRAFVPRADPDEIKEMTQRLGPPECADH